MKKNIATLFFVGIFLFGCKPTTTPEMQPADDATLQTQAPSAAATISPTELISSAAESEPIPCTIAFDSDRDGNREIYRMAPDGSSLVNLSNNPADDFDPVWSPDGSQIAFVSNRANDSEGGQFIYVMNADGSDVRQLSFENWSDWPDWSRDGSQITYTSNDDIYVIKADGSNPSIQLTKSPEKDGRSTWSPDGRQIAWVSGGEQNSNILVMNADGSNIKQITDNGQAAFVQWTVDGRLFGGWGWKDQEQFCFNCVFNTDGSNIMDAGGKGQLRRYFPFWTLDGERVELASMDAFTGDNEILLVGDLYADGFFNLTNNPANDTNPDWPAGCGQPLMMIGYAGDDPAQQQRREQFQRACDELGLPCVYGSMSELVEQDVSGIVLNSINGSVKEKSEDIQKAVEKGIPVFVLDAELDMDGTYSVTVDQQEWVKSGLEWMFNKMGGEGQIAYFDVYQDYHHADAINEVLSEYPGITVAEHGGGGDFDPGWVKPQTADFIKAHPELKAVWTNTNFDGAIQGVVEESGAPQEQWPVMLCEASSHGLNTWLNVKTSYPSFECIAVGNPAGIAYDAAYAAYTLASGFQLYESALSGAYGRSLYVDFPVVTSDTLQEWLETNPSVDLVMSPEEIKEKWFVE